MAQDLKAFEAKLKAVAEDLTGAAVQTRLKTIGTQFEQDVDQAVRADLGDNSMSGWRRNKPIGITGHSELSKTVPTGLWIAPAAEGQQWRTGFGPMRVLQDGRKAYAMGDRRQSGTRTRKKDGAVVAKYRKVKRASGATVGKSTWSDALELMRANAGRRIQAGIVQDTLRRYF